MSSDDIVRRMELMDVPPGSYDEETLHDAAAEIERLRTAGDALADDVDIALHGYSVGIYHTLAAWREARRG